MGCFFTCLRAAKNDDCSTRSHSVQSKKHPEPVLSRNPLSSLFECEGETGHHEREYLETDSFESPPTVTKELRQEAKFLKACGTLTETPCEIRKSSRRLIASSPDDTDSDRIKFHSWLSNEAIEKLQPEKLSEGPPTSVKLPALLGEDLDSQEHSPSSCVSDVETSGISSTCLALANGEVSGNMPKNYHKTLPDQYTTPGPPGISAMDSQLKSKSVRFKCAIDMFSSENENQNLKVSETPSFHTASRNSPYPTPLKLSDEMQTPGTIFPASVEANGKARIRSQYVNSVLNPVQNATQWKALKEDQYLDNQVSDELKDSIERPEGNALKNKETKFKSSPGSEPKVETSLSAWLKPPHQQAERTQLYRTLGDRPIIGLVATHWNEDECIEDVPKGWDGNGIPNSTNKYMEDQKVNWHATPFEERLEKALSEESSVTQRNNLSGSQIALDENDDGDTATSRPQPCNHPVAKSVASF